MGRRGAGGPHETVQPHRSGEPSIGLSAPCASSWSSAPRCWRCPPPPPRPRPRAMCSCSPTTDERACARRPSAARSTCPAPPGGLPHPPRGPAPRPARRSPASSPGCATPAPSIRPATTSCARATAPRERPPAGCRAPAGPSWPPWCARSRTSPAAVSSAVPPRPPVPHARPQPRVVDDRPAPGRRAADRVRGIRARLAVLRGPGAPAPAAGQLRQAQRLLDGRPPLQRPHGGDDGRAAAARGQPRRRRGVGVLLLLRRRAPAVGERHGAGHRGAGARAGRDPARAPGRRLPCRPDAR